jgi:hypothetical protein
MFSSDELRTILEDCEKNEDDRYMHCSISKDPDKRGNIETGVDGVVFNCRLPKQEKDEYPMKRLILLHTISDINFSIN